MLNKKYRAFLLTNSQLINQCCSSYNRIALVSMRKVELVLHIILFPLSCARVRAHTGRETRAQKKSWCAQTFPFRNVFAHVAETTKTGISAILRAEEVKIAKQWSITKKEKSHEKFWSDREDILRGKLGNIFLKYVAYRKFFLAHRKFGAH